MLTFTKENLVPICNTVVRSIVCNTCVLCICIDILTDSIEQTQETSNGLKGLEGDLDDKLHTVIYSRLTRTTFSYNDFLVILKRMIQNY